jgi:hypothetical protein
MIPQAFCPVWAAQTMSVTTVSSSVTLAQAASVNKTIRVYCSSGTAFIRCTKGASTATTSDYPVPSGTIEVISVGDVDTVSAVTAFSTATLYINQGEGF